MQKGDSMWPDTVQIFYCYAPEDKIFLKKLEEHLSPLQRSYLITAWSNCEINAGSDWASEIETNLNAADIILLLVSSSFFASDLCYSLQMQKALERQEAGKAKVIPIILRPTIWKETPLGKLQGLPRDNRPITQWRNRDAAFLDVVIDIWIIIKDLFIEKEKQRQIDEKRKHFAEQREQIEEDGRIRGEEWIAQQRKWLDEQESLIEQQVEESMQEWLISGHLFDRFMRFFGPSPTSAPRQIANINRELLSKAREYAKVNHEDEDYEQLNRAWATKLLELYWPF